MICYWTTWSKNRIKLGNVAADLSPPAQDCSNCKYNQQSKRADKNPAGNLKCKDNVQIDIVLKTL